MAFLDRNIVNIVDAEIRMNGLGCLIINDMHPDKKMADFLRPYIVNKLQYSAACEVKGNSYDVPKKLEI